MLPSSFLSFLTFSSFQPGPKALLLALGNFCFLEVSYRRHKRRYSKKRFHTLFGIFLAHRKPGLDLQDFHKAWSGRKVHYGLSSFCFSFFSLFSSFQPCPWHICLRHQYIYIKLVGLYTVTKYDF